MGLVFGTIAAVYGDTRDKADRPDIFYCLLYAMIGGFAGGKILYLATILPALAANPSLLKQALHSGMVFYGGVIGGIIGGYIYTRQYKVSFLLMADSITPGIPIGHVFGRLGCLAAGCCYGKPYNGIFSIVYPKSSLSAPSGIPLHPVPLYEAAGNLLLFFVLLAVKRRTPRSKGLVLWLYLVSYGLLRFFIEMLRHDAERGFIGPLSTSQWISIVAVSIGMAGMVRIFYGKNQCGHGTCRDK